MAVPHRAGRRGGPRLGRRPLHYLGQVSYATYLSHWLLFFAFKLVFVSDPRAVPPALIALYLLLVLVASVALYHGVERPAQRWLTARQTGVRLRSRNDPRAGALPGDGRQNRLLG